MKTKLLLLISFVLNVCALSQAQNPSDAKITLNSKYLKSADRTLILDGFFLETAKGRVNLPRFQTAFTNGRSWKDTTTLADGHRVTVTVQPQGSNFDLSLTAEPNSDIVKWGLA